MEKILVTTDLSANSKAGIRYALHLAQARHAQLIILNVYHVLKATSWSDAAYQHFIEQFRNVLHKELSSFMRGIFKSTGLHNVPCQLALHHSADTTEGIIAYASQLQCSYICISTRGAGVLKKVFGSNASKLIRHSTVPVICVPHNYRSKPIAHILYATDMRDYPSELKQVVAFASPLKADIEMLHLYYPYEFQLDKEVMEDTLQKAVNYKINIRYQKRNVEKTLLKDLNNAIKTSKPDLLVMFTDQDMSFLERVFFSNLAEIYSFYGKIPLLAFSKQQLQAGNTGAAAKQALSISDTYQMHE